MIDMNVDTHVETVINTGFLQFEQVDILEPIRVISFLRDGTTYEEASRRAFEDIASFARANGINVEKSRLFSFTYTYNDPNIVYSGVKLVGMIASDKAVNLENERNASIQTLEAGRYAVFTHDGLPQDLEITVATILREYKSVIAPIDVDEAYYGSSVNSFFAEVIESTRGHMKLKLYVRMRD